VATFLEEIRTQRRDDHRYYHHSRINQTLHLISGLAFIGMYPLLFTKPTAAALLGWGAMVVRQAGHFFFEPKGFDQANQVSHEYKESVKVGFNLRRKIILLLLWAASPLLLLADPTLLNCVDPARSFLDRLSLLWIALGLAALLGRTIQIFFLRDLQTGLAWFTKILTDPFADVILYGRAPLHLLRGEWIE
jgi:hypothetical protein